MNTTEEKLRYLKAGPLKEPAGVVIMHFAGEKVNSAFIKFLSQRVDVGNRIFITKLFHFFH